MKHHTSLRYYLTIVFGIMLAITGSSLFAKGSKSDKKKPDPPVHEHISSVSGSSITVEGKSEKRAYTISEFTKILLNGQPSTAADLKVGMHVSVDTDGGGKASLINAQAIYDNNKNNKDTKKKPSVGISG